MIDLLKVLGKIALFILAILLLSSLVTSDFAQRIRHLTYRNCVEKLSSEMMYSADNDPNAFDYYDKVGGPENAARLRCEQLFDVQ